MEVIYYDTGLGNRNLSFYRFSVFEGTQYGEFEEVPFFSIPANGYEIFPDTKQIVATLRANGHQYIQSAYQLTDTRNGSWLGRYEQVGEEFSTYSDEDNVLH